MLENYQNLGDINFLQAYCLIDSLSQLGIAQVVISPGSRSTPLALAAERHAKMQTWINIDERSAAFFALGLARQSGRASIVIATSGSAIANWLPAVSEAFYSHIPLLLLAADRPAELQQIGANQTINQVDLLKSQVRGVFQFLEKSNHLTQIQQRAYQALSKSNYPIPGPVHLNIPIREPLLPNCQDRQEMEARLTQLQADYHAYTNKADALHLSPASSISNQYTCNTFYQQIKNKPGLMIIGQTNLTADFIPAIEELAEHLNVPVFADPLSQLRLNTSSPFICYNYDAFLNSETSIASQPQWVLRFGSFPLSKNLSLYLAKLKHAQHYHVSPYGEFSNPLHLKQQVFHCCELAFIQDLLNLPVNVHASLYTQQIIEAEKKAQHLILEHVENTPDNEANCCYEGQIIHELLAQLDDNALLFSANSMTIRHLDTFICQNIAARKISLIANRGCSGIDGNISTFFGLLSARPKHSQAIALLGDLTTLHDTNALLMAKALSKMGYRACLIVLNNQGGAIFNYLSQQYLNEQEKLWNTAQDIDFGHLAQSYNLDFYRVTKQSDFAKCLKDALKYLGISLIEVGIDQKQSLAQHHMLKNALSHL